MAVEINVDETPEEIIEENHTEESENESWQSALSAVTMELSRGFSLLREEFQQQVTGQKEMIENLLRSNQELTSQITSNNQCLMEKLTSLTLNPSTPEVVTIVQPESPSEEGDVLEEAAVSLEESQPQKAATRKRRTL